MSEATAAAVASPVRVESEFPDWALPRLWMWIEAARDRLCDDFSPREYDDFARDWDERRLIEKRWAVYRDDEIGGLVTITEQVPGIGTSHVVFKRSFWGHDTTLEAMRQVYEQAFSDGLHRVWSMVYTDNASMIALAKRLGFEREGRVRRAALRNGEWVDMFVLGLLKEDYEKCLSR